MIGRYRIKAELGRGGMSTVYLAHDPLFDRDVAIKLLPLELLHQPTFRRRFEREAKVVAALEHSAIVPVYDFGETEGQPFLVMRFMTGGSLSDRLNQGPVSLEDSARILHHLAPALDEVHSHGVVHRDLKPSNILFDQRGLPFISDFGTAKLQDAQTKLTDTGGAVGTPAYMSPEQIQANEDLDGRSDIYTLGVILFEMLSGSHPFETNTPIAIAVKHMFEPVPRLLDMDPNLPPNCQAVIARAMAKRKEDRYPTAVSFAAEFKEVVQNLTGQYDFDIELEAEKGRRLALLIGNTKYEADGLTKLVPPPNSIYDVADVLMNPNIGGFEEVTTLVDEPADAVRRTIAQFYANKTVDDQLLLYFMGHAALGKRGHLHLITADTEPELLRGTSVPSTFIADEMDNSLSEKQIVILDCHYSDTAPSEAPGAIGRSIDTAETFARNGHQRIVVTAYDSTEYNWNNGHILGKAEPSQFTRYFIDGLRSGAADANEDGKITIGELFDYIQGQLATKVSGGSRHPQPRKWTPNFIQSSNDIVVGRVLLNSPNPISNIISPSQIQPAPKPMLLKEEAADQSDAVNLTAGLRAKTIKWALAGIGAFLLLILFGGMIISFGNNGSVQASPQAEVPASVAETATTTARATATAVSPTHTHTPPPTTAPTSTATSASSTATAATAATRQGNEYTAAAILASSIFDAPDTGAKELTFIGAGDQVYIMGRSDLGNWLYVQTDEGIEGFIHQPRLNWSGNVEMLPIKSVGTSPTATPNLAPNVTPNTCAAGSCPTLTIDAYPLAGTRCDGGSIYRTVYLRGQGGSGSYTYYWNNEKVAGPTNSGFGFEVTSAENSQLIGTGKVVSGDGQTAVKELFITGFTCD